MLLLGVTPELYSLPWPKETDFLAVDHTQAMIDAWWPGPKEAVLCADWLSMDLLPAGSRDIVLCDGGLHLLKHPQEQQRLVLVLRRILSDRGFCIFRLFVPPSPRELPDKVIEDLLAGRILDLNALKLRLTLSLQHSPDKGVALAQVHRAILDAAPDLEKLAEKIGWPVDHMLAINAYKGLNYRYYFPAVDQVIDLFCRAPGGFQYHGLQVPAYELGRYCPTIAMQCC